MNEDTDIDQLLELLRNWCEAYEMGSADQAGGLYRLTQEILSTYTMTPKDIGD
jgi:hypothetical protein